MADNSSTEEPGSDAGAGGSAGSAQGGGAGSAGGGGEVLQSPEPLRMVSWNAHNVYDDQSGTCGGCQYEEVVSSSEYQSKVTSIAGTLKTLAGDVVFLQEVENMAVLDRIASSNSVASLNYAHRYLIPGNDPRGINIALMSRYPVDAAVTHKNDQFTKTGAGTVYRYTRDALEVHMTYRGKHVIMFGVHFKAKLDPDDPDRRLAEAQHTRALADAAQANDPNAYVWIMGDFNDDVGSDPYKAVASGKNGPTFADVLLNLPASDRWSYTYSGDKMLIDHMFASPAANGRLQSGTVKIMHDTGVNSDHDPVAATFMVP